MVQDWQDWLARRETSAVSEHAHNTGHKPLWNEVKFIDRDPYYYTRRVKEAIHIRLHPNNINRDSGREIPEAWIFFFFKQFYSDLSFTQLQFYIHKIG